MTRMEEYQALRQELETVPEAIETVTNRALAREKACRKKKRIWGVPVGSLAACFALFLLLVNCFPTFAAACEGLPVLGELAEALRFDKSLRLAMENEYVQPLGLSQTENGITARMEYLIVDQKSVNLFFSLCCTEHLISSPLDVFFNLSNNCYDNGIVLCWVAEVEIFAVKFIRYSSCFWICFDKSTSNHLDIICSCSGWKSDFSVI